MADIEISYFTIFLYFCSHCITKTNINVTADLIHIHFSLKSLARWPARVNLLCVLNAFRFAFLYWSILRQLSLLKRSLQFSQLEMSAYFRVMAVLKASWMGKEIWLDRCTDYN